MPHKAQPLEPRWWERLFGECWWSCCLQIGNFFQVAQGLIQPSYVKLSIEAKIKREKLSHCSSLLILRKEDDGIRFVFLFCFFAECILSCSCCPACECFFHGKVRKRGLRVSEAAGPWGGLPSRLLALSWVSHGGDQDSCCGHYYYCYFKIAKSLWTW